MRILIIEDANKLRETIARGLRKVGFTVDTAGDGLTGLDLAMEYPFDAIVLDLMLPGCNGMEVLRKLRTEKRDTPVLILTAMADVEHRVAGLDSGADDYLAKPFSFDELVSRINALIRRRYGITANTTAVANLSLDAKSGRVTVDGKEVVLPPREFALLDYLARRQGDIVSRTEIMDHVYDHAADLMSNAIDSAVCKLRRVLEDAGAKVELRTIVRRGYSLEAREGEVQK